MEILRSRRLCVQFVMCVAMLHVSRGDDCSGMDQCSCQYSDGKMVALHSLGNSDGTAKFPDVKGSDGSSYFYNPCYPFDQGAQCTQAAVCETNGVGVTDTIGIQQSASFSNEGGLSVTYTAGSGILTQSSVQLKCNENACSPTFTAEGNIGPSSYQFTLETVCACPGGCDENGPINCSPSAGGIGGLGGGGVFLIVFLSLVFVYFIGGMAFMKFGRKATGKEIIPNVGFWSALPGYIKSGVLFAMRPCLRRGGTYDSV